MMFIGSFTTFLGATIGMLQNDIKKIMALNTIMPNKFKEVICHTNGNNGKKATLKSLYP